MGIFPFRNKKTGKITYLEGTIAEAEAYEKAHPNLEWMCGSPGIVDSFRVGLRKPEDGFRDRLREIKKSHPKGNINTF